MTDDELTATVTLEADDIEDVVRRVVREELEAESRENNRHLVEDTLE